MKYLRVGIVVLWALSVLSLPAEAQFFDQPAKRITKAAGAPSSGNCNEAGEVGKVYIRSDLGATSTPLYVCSNTGVGTYGWVLSNAGAAGGGCTPVGAADAILVDDGAGGCDTTSLVVTGNNLAVLGTISTGAGAVAGEDLLYELAANGSNFRSTLVPDALTASLTVTHANAVPTANQTYRLPAPTANVSQYTWASPAWLDIANTFGASGTLDMSAATNDEAVRLPNVAGAANTTEGAISFDTTNDNYHGGANSVDTLFASMLASALPTDGQCGVFAVSSSRIRLGGTTCGGGSSPLDYTPVYFKDDFLGTLTVATYDSGMNWTVNSTLGSPSFTGGPGAEVGHPGIRQMESSALDNDYAILHSPIVNNVNTILVDDLSGRNNWEMNCLMKTGGTITSVRYLCGFLEFDASAQGRDGIYVDFDTDRSDTTWYCVTQDDTSNITRTDTTVTVVADTWYKLRVWSDTAGTIKCSVDGTSPTGQTTNLPDTGTDLAIVWGLQTRTTGARSALIDLITLKLNPNR